MRSKFYRVIGYGTLFVDAYLVLASIATTMMKAEYSRILPPYGSLEGSETSRIIVLLVATWTATLAMGCLSATKPQSEDSSTFGAIWFIVVLVIVWLHFLISMF